MMADDPNPLELAAVRLQRGVDDAVRRMLQEHPLDTLLRNMRDHGWKDDDPMVNWVREAMAVPYPMPRWEAAERGLLPLTD